MTAYLDECANGLRGYVEQASGALSHLCESPIEVGLLQGFISLHLLNRQFRINGLRELAPLVTEYEARVYIQHEVDQYRLDFAVHVTGASGGKHRGAWIAVECDGHQFHERTKEQAKRDKARDRALATKGFRILRFTGSEIYESAFACAVDVHHLVQKIIEEWED
jgi:very-short-patch-repair endonuclease